MGRNRMSSLKTALPLAICLLLCLIQRIAPKPNPAHLLIETKDKAADYNIGDYNNGNLGGGDQDAGNFKDYNNGDYGRKAPGDYTGKDYDQTWGIPGTGWGK